MVAGAPPAAGTGVSLDRSFCQNAPGANAITPVATIATISITPESATLVQADKAPRVAKDIDSLTAQSLGWSLPVSGLRDWLQGMVTVRDGLPTMFNPRYEILSRQEEQ